MTKRRTRSVGFLDDESDFVPDNDSDFSPEYSAPASREINQRNDGSSDNEHLNDEADNADNQNDDNNHDDPLLQDLQNKFTLDKVNSLPLVPSSDLTKIHPEQSSVWQNLKDKNVSIFVPHQPEAMKIQLLPFQLEGLGWMKNQEDSEVTIVTCISIKYNGGILADEMGMGKTIQILSLIVSDAKPTLIICPTVALLQWKSEWEKCVQGMKVLVYYGNDRTSDLGELATFDVILTTFAVVESSWRKQKYGFKRKGQKVFADSPLHKMNFYRLVLDEGNHEHIQVKPAHAIKDRTCSTARAIFALNSDKKWCLSGTPLQNRVGDYFSLMKFLKLHPFSYYFCKKCPCESLHWEFSDHRSCDRCGHLVMQHFCFWNKEILKPIQKSGFNQESGKIAFVKLNLLLRQVMLRRTKIEREKDLRLPPKMVLLRRDYFNQEEEDFYNSLYSDTRVQFMTFVRQGTVMNNYAHIFELLTKMRQAVNHPYLILHRDTVTSNSVCGLCGELPEDPVQAKCRHVFCRQDIKEYLCTTNPSFLHPARKASNESARCPVCFKNLSIDLDQTFVLETKQATSSIVHRIDMTNWHSSTKIEALVEELCRLRATNAKSLVFSQFVHFLDLLHWRLHRAGFHCVKMDGRMTPSQRDAVIQGFMTVPEITVFLVSLKAGGVALNLTAASHVFIMDLWWNPSVEDQAMDRIHRLGQHRPITVKRIIIENSIESRVLMLQEKKRALFESTVGGDLSALERLTEEDLKFLFIL